MLNEGSDWNATPSAKALIGYSRASRWAGAPAEHLDEQRAALAAAGVTTVETDSLAGRTLRRPGLQSALDACREGRAAGIAVTSLDRLSRSLDDLAELFAEAREYGFRIVCLSPALDTATAPGALVEAVLAEADGWGRRTLARDRARTALDPTRRGRGRPASTPPALAARIRAMRAGGATLQAICDTLNAEGVPTPRGGTHWRLHGRVLRPAHLRGHRRGHAGRNRDRPDRRLDPGGAREGPEACVTAIRCSIAGCALFVIGLVPFVAPLGGFVVAGYVLLPAAVLCGLAGIGLALGGRGPTLGRRALAVVIGAIPLLLLVYLIWALSHLE